MVTANSLEQLMSNQKWAIVVPFEDQWLYVTDINNPVNIDGVDIYQPIVYNTHEAAEAVADAFQTYRVVKYENQDREI